VESSDKITIPLLSTAYMPPIEYFHILATNPVVKIEACENFQKQTYRSRTYIYASGGVDVLQLPVIHNSVDGNLISAKQIDYSKSWLHQHKLAITSAYRSSPFFEYYWDDIVSILDRKLSSLLELNTLLTQKLCELMNIDCRIELTEEFTPVGESSCDYRYRISPKSKEPHIFDSREYYQVFATKHGFIPHLSVLDLLFNEGPQSEEFLLTF